MAGYLNLLLVLAGSLKKKTPSGICLQTNPLREKVCKTTPLTSFCHTLSPPFTFSDTASLWFRFEQWWPRRWTRKPQRKSYDRFVAVVFAFGCSPILVRLCFAVYSTLVSVLSSKNRWSSISVIATFPETIFSGKPSPKAKMAVSFISILLLALSLNCFMFIAFRLSDYMICCFSKKKKNSQFSNFDWKIMWKLLMVMRNLKLSLFLEQITTTPEFSCNYTSIPAFLTITFTSCRKC